MSVRIGQARTDKKLEAEGAWVNFCLFEGEKYIYWLEGEASPVPEGEAFAQMRVARSGNQKAKQFREKATEQYQRIIDQLGKLPMKLAEVVVRDMAAHTILLDWKNVYIGDSEEPTPFSPEAAVQLFDKDPEFLDFVLRTSNDRQLYRDRKIAKEAADLGNASSGTSSGEVVSKT